jgi:dCMP deaminase
VRPSIDTTLMGIALLWEQQSTCDRNRVGVVIALDRRVIVTGYNGSPAGMPHCDHSCTTPNTCSIMRSKDGIEHTFDCPAGQPCRTAVHGEANTIAFAARHGLSIQSATLYTTVSPCYACAQLIVNAGLAAVVFDREYRDPSGVELLMTANIHVRTPKRGTRR